MIFLSTLLNILNCRHFLTYPRYISGWHDESSDSDIDNDQADTDGEESNGDEIDEEDKARAYAEADLIYNSVRRRGAPLPPGHNPMTHMIPMPYAVMPPPPQESVSRLQRSSSNVIRR